MSDDTAFDHYCGDEFEQFAFSRSPCGRSQVNGSESHLQTPSLCMASR